MNNLSADQDFDSCPNVTIVSLGFVFVTSVHI